MKVRWVTIICAAIWALVWTPSVSSEQVTTKVTKADLEVVVKMAEEAAAFLSEAGEKGLEQISDPNGKWVRGDLYVFVYGLAGAQRGVIIGHPRHGLIGKNFFKFKDKKGKIFATEFIKIAESEQGRGWSHYWWPKISKGDPEPKLSYIVKVPGQDMLVGVGLYCGLTSDQAIRIMASE